MLQAHIDITNRLSKKKKKKKKHKKLLCLHFPC